MNHMLISDKSCIYLVTFDEPPVVVFKTVMIDYFLLQSETTHARCMFCTIK